MYNVCYSDICMCLHVIDSKDQELQELWQNIFSLLLFGVQSCDLLTVGIAVLSSFIRPTVIACIPDNFVFMGESLGQTTQVTPP